MNRIARSALTLTAGLALALGALPARADDAHDRDGWRGQEQDRDGRHDRDRDGRQDHDRAMPAPQPPPVYRAPPVVYRAPPVVYRAPPVVYAPPVVAYAPRAVYPAPAAPIYYQPIRPAHWNGGWQSRELRREYRRLEEAREQFYAGWRGNPVRRDRFEAWYGARRAELDRCRSEPQRGW